MSARSFRRGGLPYVLSEHEMRAITVSYAALSLPLSFFLFRSLSSSLSPPPTHTACLYDKWQCDDGTCIAKELLCNGNIDCPEDISDERYCDGECVCVVRVWQRLVSCRVAPQPTTPYRTSLWFDPKCTFRAQRFVPPPSNPINLLYCPT